MRALAFALLLGAGPALADDDAAALALADDAPAAPAKPQDWRMFVESALGRTIERQNGAVVGQQRLSLDLQWDSKFATGWRGVFSDRLDVGWVRRFSDSSTINSLREAYVSWQPAADRIVDAGRINVRHGVATGYNPTDYFRSGANRSVVSVDPASLKQNRLGTAMLRAQVLWNSGSLAGTYSPKLADSPSDAPFSADLGATNNRHRALLALSQRIAEGVDPQWLFFAEEGRPPQLGFNLAALISQSTVGHVEWSGGRSRSMLSQAVTGIDDSAFRSRLAAGLTWTSANRMSIVAELQYNGAALDRAGWDALRTSSPPAFGAYRRHAQNQQDLARERAGFFYATWQDAVVNRLDLNAMLRLDLVDDSRMSWVEARYRWERTDLSVQMLMNSGRAGTEFGTVPVRRSFQVLLKYFL